MVTLVRLYLVVLTGFLIKMSSSKYFKNSFTDFVDESENSVVNAGTGKLHADLVAKLQAAISDHIKTLDNEIHNVTDSSVYTGTAGIAQLFLFMGRKFSHRSELVKADKILRRASGSPRRKSITFLTGDAGPLALKTVAAHALGNIDEATNHVEKLKSLAREAVTPNPDMPNELLYGRVGYLYSLLFVNNAVGSELVGADVIRQVVTAILESGQARARATKSKVPLVYEWHGKNYYGAAHGVAGILYILLLAGKELTDDESRKLIQPTLDDLLSVRFSSSNLPSSKGSDSDRLVQWCHGAPGFVQLLAQAHKEYGDSRYQNAALECGEVVWSRGLLTKGYSICHGIAGNAYTFLQLYQLTGDLKHLYRAGCFAEWCLTLPKHQYYNPDRPYSLFEGLTGVVYFLVDIQDPDQAGFPAYSLNF